MFNSRHSERRRLQVANWKVGFSGLLAAVALVIAGLNGRAEEAVYQHGAVAADHAQASEVGVEILKRGGNVVDAAAAVGFALSVLRPASSGIGGGGFMLIWDAKEQRCIVLDYRERAPLQATAEMFVEDAKKPEDDDKALPKRSVRGPLAAAVPGHVAGLCHAVEKYGRLPIADVVAPAIRLARDGVPADAQYVKTLKSSVTTWSKWPKEFRDKFAAFHDSYLLSGKPVKIGDTVTSPQLPALEQIAARGAAGFYAGHVAESLLELSRQNGGLFTAEDFRDVQPMRREPLKLSYHGYEVLTMPPPSSGGIAMLTTLQILEELQVKTPTASEADGVHRLTEAFKHAFADRAEFLGDADFAEVPVAKLISRDHARELASRIDLKQTQPTKTYGRFSPVNDSGTTHFSVIDADGNAVACTETVNTEYGSWIVEPKFGILLNNEMDDFAAVPGQPNAFGLIQSSANAVAPRKKPLSSMTPTIVVKDGKAVFALGAAGGPRIITATTQVLLNLIDRQQTPAAAVQAPRLHHQWLPDVLDLEPRLHRDLREPLTLFGHKIQERTGNAVTQAVSRGPDGLRAGSDARKGGRPAGW
ncbi:MAG: gamma-glutamyltranspeptidase [Planctomycetota bacterium]|nr:MAG: gamma-glutamyltranspeptidase [Planctomycetota bacterium]